MVNADDAVVARATTDGVGRSAAVRTGCPGFFVAGKWRHVRAEVEAGAHAYQGQAPGLPATPDLGPWRLAGQALNRMPYRPAEVETAAPIQGLRREGRPVPCARLPRPEVTERCLR